MLVFADGDDFLDNRFFDEFEIGFKIPGLFEPLDCQAGICLFAFGLCDDRILKLRVLFFCRGIQLIFIGDGIFVF